MMSDDLFAAMLPVVRCFEALDVAHYVGGSVASSAWGMPRTSVDVDLVAELEPWQVDRFVTALEEDYYVSAEMIHEAIDRQSCFNVIHLATSFKIDVFIPKNRPFDQASLARLQRSSLGDPGAEFDVWIASPEDVVLSKLEWYDRGQRVSERQWLDVQGVLKVQGDSLDRDYLRKWAADLDVADLLEEALREAQVE